MFILDEICVLVTQTLFFLGGYAFLLSALSSTPHLAFYFPFQYSYWVSIIKSPSSLLHENTPFFLFFLFSLVFSLSVTLFELVILEILDAFDPLVRWGNWNVALDSLLFCLVVVVPSLAFYYSLDFPGITSRGRAVAAVLLWIIFFLMSFGWKAFMLSGADEGLFEICIAQIGVVGVPLMATMSGYGAVTMPYSCFAAFFSQVNASTLQSLEKELLQVSRQVDDLDNRIQGRNSSTYSSSHDLSRAREKLKTRNRGGESGGMFSSLNGFFSGGPTMSGEEMLKQQRDSLVELRGHLQLEVDETREVLHKKRQAHSPLGFFITVMGYILSAYCIFKLVTSTINVALQRKKTIDPVSKWLGVFMYYLYPIVFKSRPSTKDDPENLDLDVQFWSQIISFFFVGLLMCASVRGFLRHIISLLRRVFQTGTHSYKEQSGSGKHALPFPAIISPLIPLFLSELIGIYFISSLLLIRMNLPIQYRAVVTRVLSGPDSGDGTVDGSFDFQFYHHYFDLIFIPAALCTSLYHYYHFKYATQKSSSSSGLIGDV